MMMTQMTLIVVMKRFMVVNDYIDHGVDDGDNDDEDGEDDDDDDENDDDNKGRTRIDDINLGRGFYRAEKKKPSISEFFIRQTKPESKLYIRFFSCCL